MTNKLLAVLYLLAGTALVHAQGVPVGQQRGDRPNGAGRPPAWQAQLGAGPDFAINLATGNVHFEFSITGFGGRGLTPVHRLTFSHNTLATSKTGMSSGFALGPGWTTSIAGGLAFPAAGKAVLTRGDGSEVLFDLETDGTWTPTAGYFLELTSEPGAWVVRDSSQWLRRYDDVDGRLFEVESSAGNVLAVEFANGRATQAVDPTGRTITFGYDSANKLNDATITGYQSKFIDFDSEGRLHKVAIPPTGNLTILYDSEDRISSYTTVDGHTWSFEYWGTTGVEEGKVKSFTDPDSNLTSFSYVLGGAGNLRTTMTDPRGNDWLSVHDDGDSSALLRMKDPLGNLRKFEYSVDRRRTKFTSATGQVWEFTYDDDGNQLTQTDPLDQVAAFTYDGLGNLLTLTQAGLTTTIEYGSPHDPTLPTKIIAPPAEAGATLLEVISEYYGPSDGPAAGVWNGLLAKVTDPIGGETRYTYDEYGEAESIEEGPVGAAGRVWIELVPDSPHTYVDAGGMTYPASFPDLPALPSAIQGRPSVDGVITRNVLGLAGDWTYDLTIPIQLGAGHEVSAVNEVYTYDHYYRLIALDRTSEEPYVHVLVPPSSPPVRSVTRTFDDDDALGTYVLTTPNGDTLTTEHDIAGRVSKVFSNDGSAAQLSESTTYFADGRLESIVRNDNSSTHLTYYDDGRLASIEHRLGAAVLQNLMYVHDPRGPVATVTDTSALGVIVRTFEHDDLGRLTSESHANQTSGAVQARNYDYDLVGNRTSHELRVDGVLWETVTYHYDYENSNDFASHNNRLTSIDRLDGSGQPKSATWCFYDNPFGSMSRIVTRDEATTEYRSTVLRYTDGGRPWLTWDETWSNTGSGPQNVVRARLLEIRQNGSETYLWRERDATTFVPVSEEWADPLDRGASLFDVDSQTGAVNPLGLTHNGVGSIDGQGRSYSLLDHLGGVLWELGSTSVSTRSFSAFGEVLTAVGDQEAGFHGAFGARTEISGEATNANRMVQIGYRFYVPSLGRFAMRDPIGLAGGLNPFAFAGNSPTHLVDPLGLTAHGGMYRGPDDSVPWPRIPTIPPDLGPPLPGYYRPGGGTNGPPPPCPYYNGEYGPVPLPPGATYGPAPKDWKGPAGGPGPAESGPPGGTPVPVPAV